MTWTNVKRKPQLPCNPPKNKPVGKLRYEIPAGTDVKVKTLTGNGWRKHRTKLALEFERYEYFNRQDWTFQFRQDGWLVKVKCKLLIDHNKAK